MNNKIEYPIVTKREGNKITKICVEDIHKMLNQIQDEMTKRYNNVIDIIDSIDKEVENSKGEIGVGSLIVGTGISQPCLTDAFDEEIGNEIAFKKAKLNANIKKYKLLGKVVKEWDLFIGFIHDNFASKIWNYIDFDLEGIRRHNPNYLIKHDNN